MTKRVILSTADSIPEMDNRPARTEDVIYVECSAVKEVRFQVLMEKFRERARAIDGDAVIGISVDFTSDTEARGIGTVITFLR